MTPNGTTREKSSANRAYKSRFVRLTDWEVIRRQPKHGWSPYSLKGVPVGVKNDGVAKTARTASPLAASAAVVKVDDEKVLPTSSALLSLATALGSGDLILPQISPPELIGNGSCLLVAFKPRQRRIRPASRPTLHLRHLQTFFHYVLCWLHLSTKAN